MERYNVTLASQNVKPLFDRDYEVLIGRLLTWSSRPTMQHKELDSGPS